MVETRFPRVVAKLLILLLLLLLPIAGCGGSGSTGAGSDQSQQASFRLGVTDLLPPATVIKGAVGIVVLLPSGVTIKGAPSDSVAASGKALGELQPVFIEYSAPTATSGARLSFQMSNIVEMPTYSGGELVTVHCTVAPGILFRPVDVSVVSGSLVNQFRDPVPGVGIVILP